MAKDFYLKAQVLHEEFQKRELHYLNTERKMNNSMLWRKDTHLPLQEYLKKINQREKETDETYRSIMKQMEELDRHADVMSLKLEKLGILRSSITTSMTPNWLQKLDSNIGSNYQAYAAHSLNSVRSVIPLSVNSVSSQTDNNIYCMKCNALIANNQSSQFLENSPSLNGYCGSNNKTEILQSSDSHHNHPSLLSETCNIPEYRGIKSKENVINATNSEHFVEENSKVEQVSKSLPEQEQLFGRESVENKNNSFKNLQQQNKLPTSENTPDPHSKNEENLSLSQSVVKEKYNDMQTADVESNIDTFIDVESVNNEFDFLESDTTNVPSKKEIQLNLGNDKSSTKHINEPLDKAPISAEVSSREPKINSKLQEHEKALNPKPKLNTGDKSETSESASGFHSPIISVVSDSDSISEKESPLTASAAYQALLGNTVLPSKTPQNISESESEDEVENALASAVQRTNVKSKSSVKTKKVETSFQLEDSKSIDKSSKLPSVNKPQSKLSKDTRKVLGLDTSSGSEVEMAVKPPSGKKIDEDSDEFDFYD